VSYQAIARKYRPLTFADLTGQEHISRTLGNALDQQRLHHAYIFSGARGTGKTTSARILAKGLNCREGITSTPCLKCPSCLEIATGHSLDVIEIDAASNTGVDNVRDVIINNIAVSPARDRHKVFIIDEVHMLSSAAFNALLKTLEEPPAHVAFIMATTELHKVPDTILSRCQHFEFRFIPMEKMTQRLGEIAALEKVKISQEGLREIARAGAGSLRDALSALDQVIAFCGNNIQTEEAISALGLVGEKTLLAFLEAIAAQHSANTLKLVEELDSRGYDLRNFTRELMAWLRHLLVIRSGITSSEVLGLSAGEIETLQTLSQQFSEEDLVRFFHLLAETEKQIKDSPHPRFQLEIGLIKIMQVARLRPLSELIERFEVLISGGDVSAVAAVRNPARPQAVQTASRASYSAPASPSIEKSPSPVPAPSVTTSVQKKASSPPELPPPSMDEPPEAAENYSQFSPFESSAPPRNTASRSRPETSSVRRESLAPEPLSAPDPLPAAIARSREAQMILSELEKINRTLLVTAMEDAQDISYANGILNVQFAEDDMFAKRVRDSSALFAEIGERLFGRPLKVQVQISGQGVAKINEEADARAKLRERAMQDPGVRMVIEKFRGEIIDVVDLSATPDQSAAK
jgi:DNA polymerase-3 subunit gamma/tau